MDYKTIKNMTTLLEMLRQSDRGIPLKTIRERLELSERHIYRLRDSISEYFNIDIVSKPDPDGPTNSKRWALDGKDIRSPVPLFLDDESWIMLQMILGRGGVFKSREQKEIEGKLRSAIESSFIRDKKRHVKTSYVKFTGARDYSGFDAVISSIGTCLRNNERARISYRAAFRDTEKKYEIDPYTLVDHGGALYLICAVPKYDGNLIRLSVDRIVSFTPTGYHFAIPDGYDPEKHLGESFGITVEEPIRVTVRLFDEAAFYEQSRIWGTDQTVTKEDDSVLISFTASGKHEILRWILSCGGNAVVLEPPELVDMAREEIEGAMARYGKIEAES